MSNESKMIMEQQDIPSPEAQHNGNDSEDTFRWFDGFLEIISSPYSVGRSVAQIPIRLINPVMFGILLNIIAAVFASYIFTSSPRLVQEQFQLQEKSIKSSLAKASPELREQIEENLDALWARLSNFSLSLSLFTGVVNGVLGVFLPAVALWILFRLGTAEMPAYMVAAAMFGYAQSISFIGQILNSLLAFVAGSSRFTTSLLLFFPEFLNLDLNTFLFLSQIELFSIWTFLAAGIAFAGVLGQAKWKGILLGAIVYCVKLIIISIPMVIEKVVLSAVQ